MKSNSFQIPSRIPQLYYGPAAAQRTRTTREKLADNLFLALFILSYFLFLIGAIIGYTQNQLYGLLLFGALGYLIGVWMRRSLGLRGRRQASGFFIRIKQRAYGARPGVLEGLLELISGNPLTPAKCRAVSEVHEKAVSRLKTAKTAEEQNRILAELDRRVHQIIYN